MPDVRGGPNDPDLSWTCMVCHGIRPDAMIGVHKRSHITVSGVEFQVNVRYCVDRPDCVKGAPVVAQAMVLGIDGAA